jgi:polyadenylate-binding protein
MPVLPAGAQNVQRQQRQFKGHANGQVYPQMGQNGPVPVQMAYEDAARNQQQRMRQQAGKFVPNSRAREPNGQQGHLFPGNNIPRPSANGGGSNAPPTPSSESPAEWSSLLANASPQQQKQMIGERLFPLVQNHL